MGAFGPSQGPPRRLYLKHGVDAEFALRVLADQIVALGNLRPDGRLSEVIRSRDEFVSLLEDAEIQLQNLTYDHRVTELLHTQRYWAIREMHQQTARPAPLIDAERRSLQGRLERLRVDLEMRVARAAGTPGQPTVLDSHTLLHFMPPNQIDWRDVVGAPQVRLILPLRVVEEIDSKKWGESEKLRKRARAILPRLEELAGVGGAALPIGDGVTFEVLVELDVRVKPVDADEEILDVARELWELSGRQTAVTLVTNDTGMRLRAEALGGVRPVGLADNYLRQ
jgi:hypothetical protein